MYNKFSETDIPQFLFTGCEMKYTTHVHVVSFRQNETLSVISIEYLWIDFVLFLLMVGRHYHINSERWIWLLCVWIGGEFVE